MNEAGRPTSSHTTDRDIVKTAPNAA